MKGYIIITPLLIALFSAIAYYIGAGKFIAKQNILHQEEVSKLLNVIDIVENQYVDSIDRSTLIENTIKDMLKDLDPHSAYISAKDRTWENERLQGHFGGVGIRFIILRDTLMVTNVIEGGPAQKAGLQPSDRIIAVDDSTIAGVGLSIEDVHKSLKGESGTPVHLTVLRKGQQHEINIVRGDIPLPSINAYYKIDDSTGYIKIDNFSDKTAMEFAVAIKELRLKGIERLILDLRNNGGGYMHTAVSVADEFLPEGKLIVYTQGVHQPKRETYATDYGNFEQGKTVVLINSSTASASEIVSGALQDNDRAIIVGRRSFGKGLVQQPIGLEDGSEMRLTVSRYYTPTGRCIQKEYGKGIDYDADLMHRYEHGELQNADSAQYNNEVEQFKTPKGRIVYGGGGIMPDVFVPIDTVGASYYYTKLIYSPAFRDFGFDYIDKHRDKFNYKNVEEFNQKFEVDDNLLKAFTDYAEKEHYIRFEKQGFKQSKERIRNQLKAELATYLFDVNARNLIIMPYDKDIQEALKTLSKTDSLLNEVK